MTDSPLVTVLLITYNHAPYFSASIESVLSQKTDFDFVIHVLDDASTDGTSDIVRKYAALYPDKVRPFIKGSNAGLIENIYGGVSSVKTKYFAQLESDDCWCDDNKLQTQVDILENNPDCSFCTHNTKYNYVKNNNHHQHDKPIFDTPTRKIEFPKKYNRKDFIKAHPSSRVFRTSCLDLENLKNREIAVWDSTSYWWFLSKGKMYYIDKVMSAYNFTEEGVFTGADDYKRKTLALNNLYAINKEFDYKYNKIFVHLVKKTLKLNIFDYLRLKYFTPEGKLEAVYEKIREKYLPQVAL